VATDWVVTHLDDEVGFLALVGGVDEASHGPHRARVDAQEVAAQVYTEATIGKAAVIIQL